MKARRGSQRAAALTAMAVLIAAACTATASAGVIGVNYDGYVAMGGMVCNTTNSYLLPGDPDSPAEGTFQTFGYAFMKCDSADLPTVEVAQALLQLDVIALQDGMTWPAEGSATLSAFATTADVTGISAGTAATFVDNISDVSSDSLIITGAGQITLDVTDIVNAWITTGDNFGMVLATPGGLMPRLHSSETTDGIAPSIATVVPEPMTVGMLAFGFVGLLLRRNRR